LENIRLKKVIVLAQMGSGAKHAFSMGVKICFKKRVKENIENFQWTK